MRRPAALGSLLLLGGCVYFNSLYNARDAWARGERARLDADHTGATEAFADAADRAARAFRRDPDGRWADEALLTYGRALVRLSRWSDAIAALEETRERAEDPEVEREARVFLGAAWAGAGVDATALPILNEVLAEKLPNALAAEGHMWRARLHLRSGAVDLGWWDLDRATDADPRLAVPAHLERVRWGIVAGDAERAGSGAAALLTREAAAVWADSLRTLVVDASLRPEWGAGAAATLLAPARSGPWAAERRNDLLFLRADLLVTAGDTLAAETELGVIAAGVGADAVDARLRIADIRLHRARTPIDLESVRTVLLPAVGDPRVLGRLEDLRVLEILTILGVQGDPVAYFAAAEFARDRMDAPGLARGLFLATAEADPDGPWAGKAVLAALATTVEGDTRRGLRELLMGRGTDPYVRAARNDYVDRERLRSAEAELQSRTGALLAFAREEASRRDVEIRSRSGGGPLGEQM